MATILIFITGTAFATTPGNMNFELWNPASYLWPIGDVLDRLSGAVDLGYQITYTNGPSFSGPQGTVPADFVGGTLLGGDRGIFMKTALHGYGQPDGMLIGVWTNREDRDEDWNAMNEKDNVYVRLDPGSFYGIAITNAGIKQQFNDNSTLVYFDDCHGLGVITGGFSSCTAGVGYPDTVFLNTANANTTSMFNSFAQGQNLDWATRFIKLEAVGDLNMILDQNLSSEFFGAKIIDDQLQVLAVPSQTDHWKLLGASMVDGPYEPFAELIPVRGLYQVPIHVSSKYPWVQVQEVEEGGNVTTKAILSSEEQTSQDLGSAKIPDIQNLMKELEMEEQARRTGWTVAAATSSNDGNGKVYLTITPGQWADKVWQYVNSYWHDWYGYETYMEVVDEYPMPDPANRDAFREYLRDTVIRGYYDAAMAEGKKLLVHLIGAKNDWEMWTNPSAWPASWQDKHDAYLAAGYPEDGYPELDLVSGYYIEDKNPPETSDGYWVPWIPTDNPYQHMDDDGVEDIVVTRWSVRTEEELLARSLKMQRYNDYGAPMSPSLQQVEIWTGELPYLGPNDTQQVMSAANAVAEVLPAASDLFMETDEPDAGVRNSVSAARLNRGIDFLVMLADDSNPLYPAKQFHVAGTSPAFTMSMLESNDRQPYCVAICCGTLGRSRTMHPDLPDPLSLQMTTAWDRGFIAMLGAESGTRHYANQIITTQVVHDLYDSGNATLSMAECWLKSQRQIRLEYTGNHSVEKTLLSVGFEGDPASRHLSPMVPTGVAAHVQLSGVLKNCPNPFNPLTIIGFVTTARGLVDLAIYDVRGRVVRTLVHEVQDAGYHHELWDGKDDQGKDVASGIYFSRLKTEDVSLIRKMALVR